MTSSAHFEVIPSIFTTLVLLLPLCGPNTKSQLPSPIDSENSWACRKLHNSLPSPWDSSNIQIAVINFAGGAGKEGSV
jgi:hypothetical protein